MNKSNSLDLEQAKQPPQGTQIHENGFQQTPSQQIQQNNQQQVNVGEIVGGNQNDFQFRSYSSYLRPGENINNRNNNNKKSLSPADLLKELKNPFYQVLFEMERFKTSVDELRFYTWLVVIVLFFLGFGTLGSSLLQYLCVPLFLSTIEYMILAKMCTLGLIALRLKDFSNVPHILALIKKSNIAQLISQILVIIIFGVGMGQVQSGKYDDKFQEWLSDENHSGSRNTVQSYRNFYEGALGLIIFFSIIYNILFFLIKRKKYAESFIYYHKKFVLDIQHNNVQDNRQNQNQSQNIQRTGNNQQGQEQQQPQQEINHVILED